MTWTSNWRSLSIYHLLCKSSPYVDTDEELVDPETNTDEENDIPFGATARSLREQTQQNTLQNQGGIRLVLASGQEICLQPIQHSGTAAEVAKGKRTSPFSG